MNLPTGQAGVIFLCLLIILPSTESVDKYETFEDFIQTCLAGRQAFKHSAIQSFFPTGFT
jgi:hypothetical protein